MPRFPSFSNFPGFSFTLYGVENDYRLTAAEALIVRYAVDETASREVEALLRGFSQLVPREDYVVPVDEKIFLPGIVVLRSFRGGRLRGIGALDAFFGGLSFWGHGS